MPYQPTTNFIDSNGTDLGKKLVSKGYLLDVYGSLLNTLAPGLTPTPSLWGWGQNSSGPLGVNDTSNRLTPVTTILGGTNWKSIAGGSFFAVAVKTDGTLWNWGNNNNGNLGINDNTTRNTPVTTILGGNNWKSVSTGVSSTYAIKTDGSLWVWGRNNGGLGVNDTNTRSTPVTTFLGGNNWKTVAGGSLHTIALKTDGTLWNWGRNADGCLGVNDTTQRNTPVTTIFGGNNWKFIASVGSVFEGTTLAIKIDGTLWTWGANNAGQLGINDTTPRNTPVTTILGGTNWKSVSGGDGHVAAIKTDGTLWTWGLNNVGQLGVNDILSRTTPVTTILGGTNWKSVDCGNENTLAIKTDGSLWWSGSTVASSITPVTTILGGNNWKTVAGAFTNFALAIQSVDYI